MNCSLSKGLCEKLRVENAAFKRDLEVTLKALEDLQNQNTLQRVASSSAHPTNKWNTLESQEAIQLLQDKQKLIEGEYIML
jgi:hypothetical protein